jgi:hypothetical protein
MSESKTSSDTSAPKVAVVSVPNKRAESDSSPPFVVWKTRKPRCKWFRLQEEVKV